MKQKTENTANAGVFLEKSKQTNKQTTMWGDVLSYSGHDCNSSEGNHIHHIRKPDVKLSLYSYIE